MSNKLRYHPRAAGRVAKPTPFGIVLYGLITEKLEASANEFARRADYSSGFISGVYSGLKKPPLRSMKDWGKLLRLDKEEKMGLNFLAELQHTPSTVRTAALISDHPDCLAATKLLRRFGVPVKFCSQMISVRRWHT